MKEPGAALNTDGTIGVGTGVQGTFADASERKQLDLAVQQQEGEAESICSAYRDLHFTLSRDGRFLDFKSRHVDDLYCTPSEFLGQRFIDVLPPEVGVQIQNGIDMLIQGVDCPPIEYPLPKGDAVEWFEARLAKLSGNRISVLVRNITESVRQREKQRLHFDRLRRLAELSMNLTHDADEVFAAFVRFVGEILDHPTKAYRDRWSA